MKSQAAGLARAGQGWVGGGGRDPRVVITGKRWALSSPPPKEGKWGPQPHTLHLGWVIWHLSGGRGPHTSRELPPSRAALPGSKLRLSGGSCSLSRGTRSPQGQRRAQKERNGRGRTGTNGTRGSHKIGRQRAATNGEGATHRPGGEKNMGGGRQGRLAQKASPSLGMGRRTGGAQLAFGFSLEVEDPLPILRRRDCSLSGHRAEGPSPP